MKTKSIGILALFAISFTLNILPASAFDPWGEAWGIVKSNASGIRYHTVGKHFNQKWITSYDSNYMKKAFGQEAQGTAEDWCANDIKNRGGRYIIQGVDSVVREDNGQLNCYFRHWK